MTKAINNELVIFIRKLEEHLNDSHLARTLRQCCDTLDRQNKELTHLYQENDELRQRLINAQQGLIEARDAILKLKGDR
ncbi:MAG: hypothetical protein EB015_07410 [Methylocystaceae bacterium]|nr:hypothetical protein [Methylocystaceae bacterium]